MLIGVDKDTETETGATRILSAPRTRSTGPTTPIRRRRLTRAIPDYLQPTPNRCGEGARLPNLAANVAQRTL